MRLQEQVTESGRSFSDNERFARQGRSLDREKRENEENSKYGKSSRVIFDSDKSHSTKNEHSNNPDTRITPTGKRLVKIKQSLNAPEPVRTSGGLNVNDRIKHERFGLGRIIDLTGVGDNAKATVEFENVGTKQLLLKYARFEVIN